MALSPLRLVSAPTVRPLSGTLPVRPFGPEGFFGTTQVDGQVARVAALATVEGKVLMLSLVGYDTTVSATLAQIWQGKSVFFTPRTGITWTGPQMLLRRKESYQQFSTKLVGTNEVHMVALSLAAHIGEGLLTPPAMSSSEKELSTEIFPAGEARFVLGNADEDEPHQRAFLANLYAMRVMLLHRRDPRSPERLDRWARELWTRGLARSLVLPVDALGIKAWMLAGTTVQWNHLIGQGVREGWLPWRSEEEDLPFAQAA